jgi:hypothetical protein
MRCYRPATQKRKTPLCQGQQRFILNRGADALADADRLQPCEPDVPRIAGLEERCDPQRRAGVRRLADAVVGHQNQCPVVGFQREANVESVAAVGNAQNLL